jgi:2-keto-4-pentenoate hydratase/2-oxohepta-3-ene-1,7-dioic acid hydratase in catechol pathway
MRLIVFNDHRLGVVAGADRLHDITHLIPAHTPPPDRMTALIVSWDEVVEAIAEVSQRDDGIDLHSVTIRPPQPRPSKIIAAPVNYRNHQEEMGGATGVYEGATIATIETYAGFCKAPSSIVGPDGRIVVPADSGRRFDHEAELGVVIGPRRARHIGRSNAYQYVFGYLPLLDVTMRGPEDRSYRKSFDTFTPIGPAIVTADEIPDPGAIPFSLTVNGSLRQKANTRDLIYDIPRLIELYSAVMTLEPGDIIATGTPEGVGEIKPGDEVMLEIVGVGRLNMRVEAEQVHDGREA